MFKMANYFKICIKKILFFGKIGDGVTKYGLITVLYNSSSLQTREKRQYISKFSDHPFRQYWLDNCLFAMIYLCSSNSSINFDASLLRQCSKYGR